LKMYRWEIGGKDTKEFPMRFHKMIGEENLFNDQLDGVNACFVISEEQKGGIAEIFPQFPQNRVIVSPNGINLEVFKPASKDLATVLQEQTKELVWPKEAPTAETLAKYKRCITFVGKAAEWKRQAALLRAAAEYEKKFPDVITLCVGTGPEDEIKKLTSLCEELKLENTFVLGPRGQPVLAEIYTVSSLGIFPSYKEPFGLVFVECMACKTPVIGANSGGPKDFVTTEVGALVDEPPETTDLPTVPKGIVTLGKTLNAKIDEALTADWKTSKGEACIKLAHEKFSVGSQVSNMMDAKNTLPQVGDLVFQLGTNNWQRKKKDSEELEFAPGSGVLHEAHHIAYNAMPNTRSYSMYPSKNQSQPVEKDASYKVFELSHDIPICESASTNSSLRWHGFSDAEFKAYQTRLENEIYEYMELCEKREGRNFTKVIAHHSFLNPLACRNVLRKRAKAGKPKIPLYCFVHGTALKMYRWEIGGKDTKEFPMRFHKMIQEEKLFQDQNDGVNACFVISEEQKGGIAEIFPEFPQDRVIVAPNGINVEKFKPSDKKIGQVLKEQTREIVWPKEAPSEASVGKYKRCIAFVGKAAEWKRQAALLRAAAQYEKTFPDLVTLCVGTGPEEEIKKLTDLCEELKLKNTFILGPRSQDVLAEIYTVCSLGIFPSFKEPFGLVFVECMACKTPVIGANSGGPKDFVSDEVGMLVEEPKETTDLSTVPAGINTLSETLNSAITKALKEDWKTKKGEACIKLAHDKFTVANQVQKMLENARKLS